MSVVPHGQVRWRNTCRGNYHSTLSSFLIGPVPQPTEGLSDCFQIRSPRSLFSSFDEVCEALDIEKIKTIGDSPGGRWMTGK